VAKGLAASMSPAAIDVLATMLEDHSLEVAITAARALAASGDSSRAARALVVRLEDLDVDNKDFLLARELIGVLARVKDPTAGEALSRLASRRTLIKRGRFAEIQALARKALEARKAGELR
jgi:hypothetical protein